VRIADEGMNVVVVGRNRERAEAVAAEVGQRGVVGKGVVCDVADRHAVRNLADELRAEFGVLDLVCLNAGVTTAGPLAEHSPEDWDWVYGVVLMGVVHGVQAFLPDMVRAGSGHILITASFVGLVPDYFLNHGPYASAKAAVIGLAGALRPEVAPEGVGVSLLIPAGVDTGLADTCVGRPSVLSGAMDARTAPHPMRDIAPRDGAPGPIGGVTGWLDATEVADMTIAGLRENAEFIITHPELRPPLEEYYSRILSAFAASPRAV
jgi:NAD(P)-dependent dehydrogenase (short-subunit alcohol dehydrogenase family)